MRPAFVDSFGDVAHLVRCVCLARGGPTGDDQPGGDVLLSRVDSAVPIGTQVVVYDVAADNDRKRGATAGDQDAVVAKMEKSIRNRQAVPIRASYGQIKGNRQDGVHLTPEGHRQLAALVLPSVIVAVGGKP